VYLNISVNNVVVRNCYRFCYVSCFVLQLCLQILAEGEATYIVQATSLRLFLRRNVDKLRRAATGNEAKRLLELWEKQRQTEGTIIYRLLLILLLIVVISSVGIASPLFIVACTRSFGHVWTS